MKERLFFLGPGLLLAVTVSGESGIAVIAGIYLSTLFPAALSAALFAICTLALVFCLLFSGSYALFERLTAAMALALFAGFVYTLVAVPLPFGEVAAGFVPAIHDPLLPETMALMGAVGSGLNLLLYSVWLHKKVGDRHGEAYFKAHMQSINLDLVLAFVLIGLAAFGFFALGSAAAAVPDAVSEDLLESLASVLEGVPFARVVFLVTGYFTLFGGIAAGLIATIRTTLLPMIVTNSCGLMLFLYVMREQGLAEGDD